MKDDEFGKALLGVLQGFCKIKRIQPKVYPLTPSASSRCFRTLRRRAGALSHRALLDSLLLTGSLFRLRCLRLRGAVPVVQHLCSEDHVEAEASDESV